MVPNGFSQEAIRAKLLGVFGEEQATVLAEVVHTAYEDLVKTSDFSELKGIVAGLAKAVEKLAEAQKRTELRLDKLAETIAGPCYRSQRNTRRIGRVVEKCSLWFRE